MAVPGCFCGLGVIAPAPVAKLSERWRKLYGLNYLPMAPHITLAYPPFIQPDSWPDWKDTAGAVLRSFRPFPVRLQKVGVFETPQNVIWLKPEDDGSLVRIRLALEEAFPEFVPALPYTFVPHMTIGFLPGQADPQVAAQKLEQEIEPIRFIVDEVSYLAQQAEGPWQVLDSIPLSVDAPAFNGEHHG